MAQPSEHKDPSVFSKSLPTTDGSQESAPASAKSDESAAPAEAVQSPDVSPAAGPESEEAPAQTSYGWRFYIVFSALVVATLLSALDGAIVAVALPTIAANLEAGPDYVWVANVYFLTG